MLKGHGTQRAWLALGCWLWACSAPYPDGKIACSADADCPSGFTCRARDVEGGELFCFERSAQEQAEPPSTSPNRIDAAVGGDGGSSAAAAGAGAGAAPSGEAGGAGAPASADQGGRGGSSGAANGGNVTSGGAGANVGAGGGGANAGAQAGMPAAVSGGAAAGAGEGGHSGAAGHAGMMNEGGSTARCDAARVECEPGSMESLTVPCGRCNSGTQRAVHTCGADCRWGALEPSGACSNETAACDPRDSRSETRGCECGRTQSRTLTCSDTCEWIPGAWDACDLAGLECKPGQTAPETRDCECGRTQSRTKTCSDSCTWVAGAWSACDLTGLECKPGQTAPETRGCECGRMQSRTKSCSDSCKWVSGEWGACDLAGVECTPGQTQMQTVACASCGTRTQQRGCAADSCKWGAWADVSSACASSCEDCAEVQFCKAPSGQPNPGGTKCRQMLKACTHEQALTDCQQDIPVVCGAVSQPFFMQYL